MTSNTETLLVHAYKIVELEDSNNKLLALQLVALDKAGKVWAKRGAPFMLSCNKDELATAVREAIQDHEYSITQYKVLLDELDSGQVHKLSDFPEPGAENPLAGLDPLGKSDKVDS